MTKWSCFWLCVSIAFYSASAYHYSKVIEPDMAKNPLAIFSFISLCGLFLCLKMEKNFKSTLLFILACVLAIVCFANYFGG